MNYTESDFEKTFIAELVSYGYKDRRNGNSTFNKNLMMFVEDFEQYLFQSQPDKCNQIIEKHYDGDRSTFICDIAQSASDFVYSMYNVAIQMRPINRPPKNTFRFKGEVIDLYTVFEAQNANKNVYAVSSQISFSLFQNSFIKPDVFVFVNGILFSFGELKYTASGQNTYDAQNQLVKYMFDLMRFNVIKKDIGSTERNKINHAMRLFYSPAMIFTITEKKKTIARNIQNFSKELYKCAGSSDKSKRDALLQTISKTFYPYESFHDNSHLNSIQRFKHELLELFSFKNIQNEILYLNALKPVKKNSQDSSGLLSLLAPRPVQWRGVNKLIERVVNELSYEERGKNYSEYLLKRDLEASYPNVMNREQEIQRHITDRQKYKNNSKNLSILLQYAAGFGKSYVACWIASYLKDLMDSQKNYAYKKIFILTDRLDLKEQMFENIKAMNISSSLIKSITTRTELHHALLDIDMHRIIIVNLQKFQNSGSFFEQDINRLKDDRFAFIIDEIHRSNDGTMHDNFKSIFEDIDNSISNNKRNLIVGVTATPTERTLQRFGEYTLLPGEGPKWYPFDAYTMNQAIEDNFVLDIRNQVFYYHSTVKIVNDSNYARSKSIYQNKERIEHNAKVMNNIMFKITFNKIKKKAKAMLACYSIAQALEYYNQFKRSMKESYLLEHTDISEEDYANKFNLGKVPRPYIVYTSVDNQYELACRVSGFTSEKQTIESFRKCENGLIIVVDKLQTGFDEPKLHTLFLDKEVHGIGAIQTLSRVNRVEEDKNDCLIYDFSETMCDKEGEAFNANKANIEKAFSKYENIVIASNILSKEEIGKLAKQQNEIFTNGIYQEYLELCLIHAEDGSLQYLPFIDIVESNIKDDNKEYKRQILELLNKVTVFLNAYNMTKDIIELPSSMLKHAEYQQMRKFETILKDIITNDFDKFITEPAICEFSKGYFDVNRPFIVEEDDNVENVKITPHKSNNDRNNPVRILNQINKFNLQQEGIELDMIVVENLLNKLFLKMKEDKEFNVLNSIFYEKKENNKDYTHGETYEIFQLSYKRFSYTIKKKLIENATNEELQIIVNFVLFLKRLFEKTPEMLYNEYEEYYFK